MICIPDDPKFKSLIWEMVLCFRAHQVPSEAFSEDMRATHPAGMILVMHHVQELDKAIAAVFEDIKEKQGADKYKSEPLKPGKPYNVLFYAMCTQKFNYIKRSRQDAPAGAAAPTTPAAAVAPTTPAAAAAAAAPTFLSAVAAASNTQSSAHMTPAMPGPCESCQSTFR